jgi:hypothetical protein
MNRLTISDNAASPTRPERQSPDNANRSQSSLQGFVDEGRRRGEGYAPHRLALGRGMVAGLLVGDFEGWGGVFDTRRGHCLVHAEKT